MPDGTVGVPLWRFKGSEVPLNLDRYHPFGCAAEAVLPRKQQRRFAPKTIRCVNFGYEDNSLSYVLGVLPGYNIIHTAHAYFDDDDFPCRSLASAVWDDHPPYDAAAHDPLGPWLGSAGVSQRPREPLEAPQALVGPADRATQRVVAPLMMEAGPLPAVGSPVSAEVPQVQVQQSAGPQVRRSQRGWHPSAVALRNIAAGQAVPGHVAMLNDGQMADVLDHGEVDMVFSAADAVEARCRFEEDILYATQDDSVPRTYAQVLKLPPEARAPWLDACRAQCRSFLAIPAISGVLRPSQWTRAPPIRLSCG
jgi:hypothetical protein